MTALEGSTPRLDELLNEVLLPYLLYVRVGFNILYNDSNFASSEKPTLHPRSPKTKFTAFSVCCFINYERPTDK